MNQVVCFVCGKVPNHEWLCTNLACSNMGKTVRLPLTTPQQSPAPSEADLRDALKNANAIIAQQADEMHGIETKHTVAVKERDEEIVRLRAALAPIECAGDGSSPEFAMFFGEAAKSPRYWTEVCAIQNEEIRRLRDALEVINKEATECLQRGSIGDTERMPQPINYVCLIANKSGAALQATNKSQP